MIQIVSSRVYIMLKMNSSEIRKQPLPNCTMPPPMMMVRETTLITVKMCCTCVDNRVLIVLVIPRKTGFGKTNINIVQYYKLLAPKYLTKNIILFNRYLY